ncbi:hypothetical protein JCM12296A_17720 [Desulfosarcina cetonica]|uniref:DUF2062 domain-containing protein n=1 Tax=Desulfosarcina cetonica TaxID=90730 RepID=UPI0006D12F73|nr:DUF2062 domain-containing protein [Desulfosarcina cetonica]
MNTFQLKPAMSAIARLFRRLGQLNGTPREIALGCALGILIGMTPFWGLQIALTLAITSLLRWNRLSAVIGANITNVFTAALIYPVNYWVGVRLVGFSEGTRWPSRLDIPAMEGLITQSPHILVDLTAGGLILGIPLAIGGYFLTLKGVRIYRRYFSSSAGAP